MTNEEKLKLLNTIRKSVTVSKKINNIQYAIRCPICGDSQKELNTTHCYIKCGYDPSEPLLYNCFKCNSSGKVGPWFLRKLGIDSETIKSVSRYKYNRIVSPKKVDINIITGDPIMNSPQTDYIESRLGTGFTESDYDRFKIIWNMDEIIKYITSDKVKNSLPSNEDTISFLSDDKCILINRTFIDSNNQWRKISIIPNEEKSFYTIKSTIDLFTQNDITINIAEGVLDVLSIYKNFSTGENGVYIATLGSDYISAVEYALNKGFIGSNIVVKIYIDDEINEEILIKRLKEYKWMFKSIYVYKNILSKDVGVSIDKIRLVMNRV